jgi:hypothetical protein
MTTFGSLLGKNRTAKSPPTPARPAAPAPSQATPEPVRIEGKHYAGMPDFEGWQPWRRPVKAGTWENEQYIPLRGGTSDQNYNYPAALERMFKRGWEAGQKAANAPRTAGFAAGGHRAGAVLRHPPANPVSALRQGFARPMVNNWQHIKLFKPVDAVAFRGDRRPPAVIQAAGGFHPPSTRVDETYCRTIAEQFYQYLRRREGLELDAAMKAVWVQAMAEYIQRPDTLEEQKFFREYHFWRQVMQQEEMHLVRMTEDSVLKGYISTTRDIGVASGAKGGSYGGATGEAPTEGGWIYVVRVWGGFLLKYNQGGYTKKEAEISKLGSVPWDDVVGFAYYEPFNFKADLTIYMSRFFRVSDYRAFREALATISSLPGIGRGPLE